MDAKQIIDEYENLFDWEKEEVKNISTAFSICERVWKILFTILNGLTIK